MDSVVCPDKTVELDTSSTTDFDLQDRKRWQMSVWGDTHEDQLYVPEISLIVQIPLSSIHSPVIEHFVSIVPRFP